MKNYDETIETVFRRMGEYEAEKKQRRTRILYTAMPLCCLLVLMCAVLCKPTTPTVTPPATQIPTIPAGTGPFLVATDPLTDNMDVIVIQSVDTIPSTGRMMIALMWDDFIPMDPPELCAYYGTNVFPEVPADLSRDPDEKYGIFKRENGTGEIYWDSNAISFSNDDYSRSVTVNIDSDRIPVDFCNLFDEIKDRSTIHGVQVGIAKTDYGAFYAEFMYNGTGFRVFAEGLEKEELVGIIKSLIA